jgi:hypothetical protein
MKPSAFRIERILAKVEAELVPPPRRCLRAIVEGDEAEAKDKAPCRAHNRASRRRRPDG